MSKKINLSIPKPCHENWQAMKIVEKGRFCTSCQKNVIDFSKATDNQIIESLNNNDNLCGRFLVSQLDRTIEKPHLKKKNWLAFATLTSFLSFGSQEIFAQESPIKTEQTDKKTKATIVTLTDSITIKTITGIVSYDLGPLAGAHVTIKGTDKIITTNFDGGFFIEAKDGEILSVTSNGFLNNEVVIKEILNNYNIVMKFDPNNPLEEVVVGGYCVRRNFFGRQIQKIRNIFR